MNTRKEAESERAFRFFDWAFYANFSDISLCTFQATRRRACARAFETDCLRRRLSLRLSLRLRLCRGRRWGVRPYMILCRCFRCCPWCLCCLWGAAGERDRTVCTDRRDRKVRKVRTGGAYRKAVSARVYLRVYTESEPKNFSISSDCFNLSQIGVKLP